MELQGGQGLERNRGGASRRLAPSRERHGQNRLTATENLTVGGAPHAR